MDPITVTDLTQVGRLQAPDPAQPRVYVTYNADFSAAADVTLDFTIVNQGQVFGVVRSLFIDNGSNPELVEVAVSGTDDFFTVPAFAQGVFKVNATMNSLIRFTTDGGATDKVTISVYNWEVAPSVWYKFGAVNKDIPLKVQGAQPAGTDMDAPTEYRNPVMAGGVDNTGALRRLLTDNTGRLIIVGSGVGAQVYGPDAIGAAPTQPPIFVSGLDNAGKIKALYFNAANALVTHDIDALAQLVAANVLLTTIETDLDDANVALDDIVESTAKSAVGTTSIVADAAADTLILALNVQRQGATIWNDSTEILYLLLSGTSGAASLTNCTVKIAADGYYEVPAKYTGQIRGIWAANGAGAARVTELV